MDQQIKEWLRMSSAPKLKQQSAKIVFEKIFNRPKFVKNDQTGKSCYVLFATFCHVIFHFIFRCPVTLYYNLFRLNNHKQRNVVYLVSRTKLEYTFIGCFFEHHILLQIYQNIPWQYIKIYPDNIMLQIYQNIPWQYYAQAHKNQK